MDDVGRRLARLEKEVAVLRAEVQAQRAAMRPPEPAVAADAFEDIPEPQPEADAWTPGQGVHNRGDLESQIGGKWLAVAGITLLVVAVVVLFQLAIARGWIGHTAQIVLGALFGVLVWGAGVWLGGRERLTGFAQVLSAGGVAITSFAVFAAHHFETYQEATGLSLLADSILLGLLGIAAAADAGLRRVPVQAATTAALILWTSLAGLDATAFSLAYAIGMSGVLLAVGVWRGWPWMAAAVAPTTGLVILVHLIDGTASGLVLAAAVVSHVLLIGTSWKPREIDAATALGQGISWMTVWILGGIALTELSSTQAFTAWSLGVAAAGYAAAIMLSKGPHGWTAAGIASLAALAAPLFLEEPRWQILSWLGLFLVAEVVHRARPNLVAQVIRPILGAVLLVHVIVVEAGSVEVRADAWAWDAAIIGLSVLFLVVAMAGDRRRKDEPIEGLHLGLAVVQALILSHVLFDGPLVSVTWAGIAITLVVLGFAIEAAPLRIAGLTVFATVLGRVVFVDLAGVDAFIRVLAFALIAALLLAASWLYVRRAGQGVAD